MLKWTHHILAVLLFSLCFADVFIWRSKQSLVVLPREWIMAMRKNFALTEMFLYLVVLTLGLILWIPGIKAYPPAIFHTKLFFAIVFLMVGKVRMLQERKGKFKPVMTQIMFTCLVVNMALGAWYQAR